VTEYLFDSVNILKNMVSFDKAEQLDGFSKVVIIVSDEIEYSAGTDTGRTLTLNCPWGTQEVADNVLKTIQGFQYQPMTVSGALVDPAAELGDGITANGVYSGIYSMYVKFNSNLPVDVSAPSDEELYEEHTYIPKTEREVTRKFLDFQAQFRIQDGKITAEVEERKTDIKTVKSTLEVQASQIVAKVNKVQENTSTTFGWALETDSWRIFAGSSTVLKATKDGLEVKGKITATSGTIGGFTINNNYISYNNQTWGGTNTTGIYIGVSGIQLGKNFKVDSGGNLTAASGTFTGYVNAGSIRYGSDYGTLSGSGITSRSIKGGSSGAISYSTLTTDNMISGINTALSNGNYAANLFSGVADYSASIKIGTVSCTKLYQGGSSFSKKSITFKDGDGYSRTISYWG
jgi:hypothetical protein